MKRSSKLRRKRQNNEANQALFKLIVDARNFERMVPSREHPLPGEYVLTGLQAGNARGERGWQFYVGYVVQVRKEAGAFGSDLILLRHPDGTLMRHENQAFFRIADELLEQVKKLFTMTPADEDYTYPFTLGEGRYPEVGAVIEPKPGGPAVDNSPLVMITVCHSDGSKTIEAV